MPSRLVLPALFVAGALVSGITMLHGVQPNDEGLMLQAAERIHRGQVPYRDFWWFYPPGQPYLLAWLRDLFGPSLLTWRIVRVLADATVAMLAYALARRGAGPRASLLAWAVSILAMAYPSGPHPFPIALALCLGALLAFEERPGARRRAGRPGGAVADRVRAVRRRGDRAGPRRPWRFAGAAVGHRARAVPAGRDRGGPGPELEPARRLPG